MPYLLPVSLVYIWFCGAMSLMGTKRFLARVNDFARSHINHFFAVPIIVAFNRPADVRNGAIFLPNLRTEKT